MHPLPRMIKCPMLKPWPVLFNDFILGRVMECYEKLLRSDPEFTRLDAEMGQAMDRLMEQLDPAVQQFFLDYESTANTLARWENELIYRQGLIDGLRLADWVDRIKRGEELEVP